jgi:hypothetical protein
MSFAVQGRPVEAEPTFGTEGASGRAPVTRAQGRQRRGALAQDVASRASGGADKAPKEARRPGPGVATSAPKVSTILDTWPPPTCKADSGRGRGKGGRV